MRILLELIGGVALAGIVAAGIAWIARNVTVRRKD